MNQLSIRIVLVEPAGSLNIGAVARAMHNFGFSDLVLVAPRNYNEKQARDNACWGVPVLENLRQVATLAEALTDCELSFGFSARAGSNRPALHLIYELPRLIENHNPTKIAFVFGPEESGLRGEHVEHCRYLIKIPSSPENPSLNLAQAVLLGLFEVVRSQRDPSSEPTVERELPNENDFVQLNRLIDEVMKDSEFWHASSPRPVPGIVRMLLRRTDPSRREMGILLGWFSRIAQKLRK
jgi:TrmH family RNA methyltransferase